MGAIDTLSKVTGLSAGEMQRIWREVQENGRRLRACKRHRFESIDLPLGAKRACLACGGTMAATDIAWYCEGYAAAGGNPDDVMPGFSGRRR